MLERDKNGFSRKKNRIEKSNATVHEIIKDSIGSFE